MYKEFFGLKEEPFENTLDPRFLYRSSQMTEALSRLQYVVENRKGSAVLTGVYGCGKTLLANTLVAGLNQRNYQTAFITNPQLTSVELLRAIARHLGAGNLPHNLNEMSTDYFLEIIEDILINNAKDGRDTLIIIDEAHVIADLNAMEELRLLLNFQFETRFLLTLLLMGQPELSEKISKAKQLLQRIAISFHIGPLSYEEVASYIVYRLGVAGVERQIFNAEAIEVVYRMSGGIPRRINNLCDLSLLLCSARNSQVVAGRIVEEAAATSFWLA